TSPQRVQQPVVATQQLTTEKELARQALGHFSRAQELLRQGDWAGYGEELKKVEALLREMQKSREKPRFQHADCMIINLARRSFGRRVATTHQEIFGDLEKREGILLRSASDRK